MIRTLAIAVLAITATLPSIASAKNVSIDLTEIVLDEQEAGADLALVGILPQLETAFPQARGFQMISSQGVSSDCLRALAHTSRVASR